MTRGWRLLGQLALLPILWVLDTADGSAFELLVSAAILIVWPVTVATAAVLVLLARAAASDPEGAPASLVEAADNAVTMALISTGLAGAGIVAIGRVVFGLTIEGRPILVLLGWALVLVGVPSLSWARTLRQVWLPMLTGRRH